MEPQSPTSTWLNLTAAPFRIETKQLARNKWQVVFEHAGTTWTFTTARKETARDLIIRQLLTVEFMK